MSQFQQYNELHVLENMTQLIWFSFTSNAVCFQ